MSLRAQAAGETDKAQPTDRCIFATFRCERAKIRMGMN
jgi:hypothetical protein